DTLRADVPIDVHELDVLGTLYAPSVHADIVHVGPQGILAALPGADGAAATGVDPTGGTGAPGGSIVLTTSALVVDAGGLILGGAGGGGGDARGVGLVTGGAGGAGGSVFVSAAWTRIAGRVLPGAGGA